MTEDFASLLNTSVAELEIKTGTHHRIWRLGEENQWDVDQDEGDIIFSFSDGTVARAPVQIIGTLDTSDSTWLWAWGNGSITEALMIDALKLRTYGGHHGVEKLTCQKWLSDEAEAWSLTALAVKLCNAQCAYRGADGTAYVYMTFGAVTISRSRN